MLEKSQFVTKVYATVGGALILSALTAFFASTSPAILAWLANSATMIAIAVIDLILVAVLTFAWRKLSPTTATLCLALYALLDGLLLSSIFLIYDFGSVISIFFACAGLFILLALFSRSPFIDTSHWGSILTIGLLCIIVMGIVNVFLGSSLLHQLLSGAGLAIFVGITIYDQQKINELADAHHRYHDQLVVPMALSLYLDFINIFLRLLELFGKRDD
ncbi:Bax inhibitor-1/YccA family protein [bacterium]|nr:Bax inhibitor-1/YccA family protein [bacterium]